MSPPTDDADVVGPRALEVAIGDRERDVGRGVAAGRRDSRIAEADRGREGRRRQEERDDQQDGRERHAGRRTAKRGDGRAEGGPAMPQRALPNRSLRDVRALGGASEGGPSAAMVRGSRAYGTGGARVRRGRRRPRTLGGDREPPPGAGDGALGPRPRIPVRAGTGGGRCGAVRCATPDRRPRPRSPMCPLVAGARGRDHLPMQILAGSDQITRGDRFAVARSAFSGRAPGRGRAPRRLAVPGDVVRPDASCPTGARRWPRPRPASSRGASRSSCRRRS